MMYVCMYGCGVLYGVFKHAKNAVVSAYACYIIACYDDKKKEK